MKLKKLLNSINYKLVQGNENIEIKDISYDSKIIKKNYAFICLIGKDKDGHEHINEAIEKGANCIIVCKDINIKNKKITVIKVKDTRKDLSYISANLYDNPQAKLIKIGITGTKGKTTTSWMIKSILEEAKEKVGIIGTLGTYIGKKRFEHKNTTPESYLIQKYLKKMVEKKIKYVIIETSSQALKVGRINNIEFDYAIFTNLAYDHIGPREHISYEDYRNSKAQLFNQTKIGIINKDDKEYKKIIKNKKCKIYTYGKKANLKIKNIKQNNLQIEFELQGIIKEKFKLNTIGEYNAYNAIAAILTTKLLNIDLNTIKKGLEKYKLEGRSEIIKVKDFNVVIDYAHNKLSIESIIKTLKKTKPNRIITIIGCGGGRDKIIRYEIGKTTGKESDISIITTDNPRYDNNKEIIKDIEKGLKKTKGKYKIIENRKEAIIYALKNAQQNDTILILGKGHEKYQEIKGKKYSFDEKKIVNEYKKGKNGKAR